MEEKIIIIWNKMAEKYSLSKVKLLTSSRKKRLSMCIKDVPDLNDWIKIIQEVPRSEFNLGHNDRKWKASIDWLINTNNNYAKLLEASAERNTEVVIKKDSVTPSRFNTQGGYKKTVNGVGNKEASRRLGDILKEIL